MTRIDPSLPPRQPPQKQPPAQTITRRGFWPQVAAIAVGAIALAAPLASALVVFFDPLWRRGPGGKLIRVATLDAVPDDGIPREFPVVAERVDAWNRSREPIGAVYLRRAEGQKAIECLTATCPHAGCFVGYDSESSTFRCPCHNSSFMLDGKIIDPSPSPRAMDTLDCKVQNEAILVRFQSFYSGKTEKVAKQ